MEAALGAELLDRSVKPPRLNSLGSRVLEQARDLLQRTEALKSLTSSDAEPHGLLRIGLAHALAEGTLIEPIRALTEKGPTAVDAFLELQIRRGRAAGRVPFGHSNLIPVRLYRIDKKIFTCSNGVTTLSLVGTADCAIALTAKPIPAMREVDGKEAEVHVFFSPVIMRRKSAGG
jgi:hypothetical protein